MFSLCSIRWGLSTWKSPTTGRIIIYDRTILDCEVTDGRLHDAREVIVDVFGLPPDMDIGADRLSLIESLIEEIATTAEITGSVSEM